MPASIHTGRQDVVQEERRSARIDCPCQGDCLRCQLDVVTGSLNTYLAPSDHRKGSPSMDIAISPVSAETDAGTYSAFSYLGFIAILEDLKIAQESTSLRYSVSKDSLRECMSYLKSLLVPFLHVREVKQDVVWRVDEHHVLNMRA